jgi:hypothetical protein
MSHPRILVHKPKPQPTDLRGVRLWGPVLAVIVLFAGTFIGLSLLSEYFRQKDWLTAEGRVLNTRIVVDHVNPGSRLSGGSVTYRLEALVDYDYGGQQTERWLPVSYDKIRAVLEVTEQEHFRYCQVYWQPQMPENARCRLR